MAKLVITDTERMQLIGLLSVGAQLLHQLNTVDQAMCRLLDVQPDFDSYSGHINDTLYEADTQNPVHLATALLARLGIRVDVEPEKPEQWEPAPDPRFPDRIKLPSSGNLPDSYILSSKREEPPC